MTKALLVLEYFKLLISWPVAVTVISLVFIQFFRKEIAKFLTEVCNLKAGPVEMSRQPESQPQKEKIEESLEKNDGIQFTDEQMKTLDDTFNNLVNEVDSQKQTAEEQKNLIQFLATKAELNEFAYLSLFFVPNTKNILAWFNNVGQATNELYNLSFLTLVPDDAQRETILNVLLTNEMIEFNGNQYIATDKARRFLKFIGTIS